MSTIVTNTTRTVSDHFEPEPALEPAEQRRLRGHLEQIDYAAYAANREVLSHALGRINLATFERLAVAAAHARAKWVETAVAASQTSPHLSAQQTAQLAALRSSYEELAGAYEALRRLVARGYVSYQPTTRD
ncbi:MAG: hypothetical protein K2P58_10155 [Hyphomonadaceae bacterium]|nr:hypothetical protein [Hyphomonadaceae bacterium]